jgi:signal transduction histidine kinase
VLLIVAGSILTLGSLSLLFEFSAELPIVGGMLAALIGLLSPALHKAVQGRVSKVLYGCYYDFVTVATSISEELAQTLDRYSLTRLLAENLPGQMGISRATVLLREDSVLKQQGSEGAGVIAVDDELCCVLLEGQVPMRVPRLSELVSVDTQNRWQPYAWGRLFVPLILKEQLKGILILGERRSGDVYSEQDLRIVAAVARQGALAYENVQLVEMLRGLNRRLVRADEEQRKRIVHHLHDTVLQQMFLLKQGLLRNRDGPHAELVDEAIRELRHLIKDQRPPLLDKGLELALQSLVEGAQEVAGESPVIVLRNTLTANLDLVDEKATALYRIVQESLTNALKHANAQTITVEVERADDGAVRLCIDDDGVGIGTSLEGAQDREGHYGLIGMRERAVTIGAQLDIVSTPEGTRVEVRL